MGFHARLFSRPSTLPTYPAKGRVLGRRLNCRCAHGGPERLWRILSPPRAASDVVERSLSSLVRAGRDKCFDEPFRARHDGEAVGTNHLSVDCWTGGHNLVSSKILNTVSHSWPPCSNNKTEENAMFSSS